MRSVASKPATIDAYLSRVKGKRRAALEALRRTIRGIVPEAEECVSYGMPAFRLDGRIVAGFAATAKGCSYYPFSGSTLATLTRDLARYEGTRSAVHFEPDRPLPAALVRKLIRARIAEARRKRSNRRPLTASGRGPSGGRPRPAPPRRGR
jgi:uncharacterized protein YdhG (YjbR/CyaY superfamily)